MNHFFNVVVNPAFQLQQNQHKQMKNTPMTHGTNQKYLPTYPLKVIAQVIKWNDKIFHPKKKSDVNYLKDNCSKQICTNLLANSASFGNEVSPPRNNDELSASSIVLPSSRSYLQENKKYIKYEV